MTTLDQSEGGEVYVPGEFRCAKCSFTLSQFTLNAHSGAVGERDHPGEKCPNDGSPLWRVTWKQRAHEHYERAAEEMARANKAEAALAALSSIPEQGVGVKALDLRTLVPGFRLDWSGLRSRFEDDALRLEKLTTYESRAAYLDEMARQFKDAVNTALAPSHPAAVAVTDEMVEPDLLAKLGENISLELSWGPWDGEIESECFWRVHQRRGNRNDQEWDLLGYGRTPADAIRRALADRDRVK